MELKREGSIESIRVVIPPENSNEISLGKILTDSRQRGVKITFVIMMSEWYKLLDLTML
jgi:hypothetical protein